MKKFVYISLFALAVCACGGDDDNDSNIETKNVEIELSKQSVDITYGGSEVILCNNVNATECDITIDDNYVAFVSTSKNTINVVARHVGRTQITVSKNGSQKTIDVTVRPSFNIIGMPYVLFGESMENIKSKYPSSAISMTDNGFIAREEHDYLRISHHYYFENDKLDHIVTMSYHDQQTNKYFNQYKDATLEYASYLEAYPRKYYGISTYTYIYNRNDKYYIGLYYFDGNSKGWYIDYRKTADELK